MSVDANVLVYTRILEAPSHEAVRDGLRRAEDEGGSFRISRQVLREYLATMIRPQHWENPLTRRQALDDVQVLSERFDVLEESRVVTGNLIALCRDCPVGGRQIHDANIVATMLAYGEMRLLTFNTTDLRRYEGHIELVRD